MYNISIPRLKSTAYHKVIRSLKAKQGRFKSETD